MRDKHLVSVERTNERDGNKRNQESGSTLSLLVAEGLFGSDSSLFFLVELLLESLKSLSIINSSLSFLLDKESFLVEFSLQGLESLSINSSSLSFLVEFSFQGLDSLVSFLA